MQAVTQESAESSSSSHSTLLRQVRTQDPDAWRRLVYIYGPLIYQWCRSQRLQAADAADVMQEVFHSVAASIKQFAGRRPGSFRGWLWMIARNKIRDFHRRERKQVRGQGGSDAMQRIGELPDAEPQCRSSNDSIEASQAPQHRALLLLQKEFEPQTWQAFKQVVIDSRSVADVAADMEMTANAVRIAKCRVLKRLREEFGDLL
jgi:RNA polymerase sigma-70 factor (ECF subfamily)